MGDDCQRACRPRCDVAMNVAGTCTTLLMSRHTQTHRQVSRYLPHCPPSTRSRLHWTLPVCVGLKLKTTRHGQRANGRADGERFHVKLACRDTNDLKALNRSEQAAGCRLHAAGSTGRWQHLPAPSTQYAPGAGLGVECGLSRCKCRSPAVCEIIYIHTKSSSTVCGSFTPLHTHSHSHTLHQLQLHLPLPSNPATLGRRSQAQLN